MAVVDYAVTQGVYQNGAETRETVRQRAEVFAFAVGEELKLLDAGADWLLVRNRHGAVGNIGAGDAARPTIRLRDAKADGGGGGAKAPKVFTISNGWNNEFQFKDWNHKK